MQKTFRFSLISWISILIPLTAGFSFADAVVSHLTGEVVVVSTEGERILKSGDSVPAGNTVRTKTNALVLLTLDDGSLLKLNGGSEITLSKSKKEETEVALISGSVFSKIKKSKERTIFRVRTQAATMGVRGTEFFTSYGKKDLKSNALPDVWMCVHEGEVEVENFHDGKKTYVKEGMGIEVPAGKATSSPRAYSWTSKLNWNMDPGKGPLIDKATPGASYQNLLDQNYD